MAKTISSAIQDVETGLHSKPHFPQRAFLDVHACPETAGAWVKHQGWLISQRLVMFQPCSRSKRMNGQHQWVMILSVAPCSTMLTPKRPFYTVTMNLMKKGHPKLLRVLLYTKYC